MMISVRRISMAAILIAALALLAPLSAFADLTQVNPDAATAVLRNWMQYSREMQWSRGLDDVPTPLEITYQGQLLGYVSSQNGGYVVVPAYAELPPISAYSSESSFNVADEGGFVQMLKEALSYKIEVARAVTDAAQPLPEMRNAQAQIEKDRELWQKFSGDYAQFSRAIAAENAQRGLDDVQDVGPLCHTAWHQNAPFNNFCPLGDGGRTVVGCVATAAAQILAYWRAPAYGTGSHSYIWSGDNSCGGSTPSQTLSATYSDSYDWANALDSYSSGYNQAQADAVAEISYEVATAVNMDFGRCGSGSSTSTVATILPQYFGMASGINIQYRNSYANASDWFTMLQQELNTGRVMQYRIQSHSIVCDGWRVYGGNQIHLNYGWADSHTAWYTVDALYCTWTGCDPMVEFILRYIHPVSGAPSPSITVGSPNGGENWTVGSTHNVTWSTANLSENVTIELNRSYPSSTWELIAGSVANSGSYAWAVSGATTSAARIRVRGAVTTTVADTSNANFTISTSVPTTPSLTVTAPNGGENWTSGTTHSITWSAQNFTENVAIELDRAYPSGVWETLASSAANVGTWSWAVSGTTTSTARVRVHGVTTTSVGDTSNGNFTISANTSLRQITVVSPNGGEVLVLNSYYLIRWTSANIGNTVKIYVNRDYPSGSWQTITSSTPNDGEYLWLVSGTATANARIRISGNASTSDISDANFQIASSSQLLSGPVPTQTKLDAAYPNPFNPTTQIRFDLATAGHVTVDVFDMLGRQVATLVNGELAEGSHSVTLDGRALSAGLYFVRLRSGDVQNVQKIQLLK